jgi:hypothetical protein
MLLDATRETHSNVHRRLSVALTTSSGEIDVGRANAMCVYRHAAPRHLAPIEYRVFPRHRLGPAA